MNKFFKSMIAISPVRLTFIAIFVFLLLYIFVFLDTSNILCINSLNSPVGRLLIKYSPVPVNTKQIPLSKDHPNVISSGVFFNIAGEVEQITEDSVKLRSHDGPLPVFKINSGMPVFKVVEVGKPPEEAKLSEVKTGMTLVISVTFNFASNDWIVNRLTIDNNLKPRPSK